MSQLNAPSGPLIIRMFAHFYLTKTFHRDPITQIHFISLSKNTTQHNIVTIQMEVAIKELNF